MTTSPLPEVCSGWALLEAAAAAILGCEGRGRISFANRAAARLFGLDAAALIGRHLAELQITPAIGEPLAERTLKAVVAPVDSAPRNVQATLMPLADPAGGFVLTLCDLGPADADDCLRPETYQRLQDVTNLTSDWIWETDGEHRFVFVSEKIIDVSGRPASWFVGKTVDEVMATSDDADVRRHLSDLRQQRPVRNFVYWIERDFGRRCCSVSGEPLFDAKGAFLGYRGVGSDITELMLAQERQQMLLGELQHRLTNTMAVVDAVLAQTLRRTTKLDNFVAMVRGRLASIGRAHKLLDRASWHGVELRDVLASEFSALGLIDRLQWRGEQVLLGPSSAVTLSLIFHELVTNSLKYGALSADGGMVHVDCRKAEPGAEETSVHLVWQEAGGPPVATPVRAGFGRQLIERTVSHHFSGETLMQFAPEGFSCRLRLRADTLGR